MIQRIQTVFLFLAVVAMGLFLWMPLIRTELRPFSDVIHGWEVTHRFNGWIYFINPILVGTAMVLTVINIFLFKNRDLQMLVCWFSIAFIAAASAYVYYKYQTWIFPGGDVILTWWNLLAAVAALFEILALAYIRKDENTIKSLDRLR
jgi:Domain of unknown function (DUF4293)